MKLLLTTLICAAALATVLFTTGCDRANAASGPSSPPHSKPCTIQFRRDALGAAASLPVGPLTDNVNGAETSISGTLKFANDDWVVLDRGGKEIWVSKAAVLLIHFR